MNTSIYLNNRIRDESIAESIVFGSEIILSALIIKDLNILRSTFDMYQKGNLSAIEYKNIISPFVFESYVDAFKICTYFENYSKVILLMRGYLIHNIRRSNSFSKLYERQRKEPYLINDFIAHGTTYKNLSPEDLLKEGLTNNTLSPSTMFQSKYRREIDLPEGVFMTVKKLTEKRNALHFLNDWEIDLSDSLIKNLEEIKSFVRNQIVIK